MKRIAIIAIATAGFATPVLASEPSPRPSFAVPVLVPDDLPTGPSYVVPVLASDPLPRPFTKAPPPPVAPTCIWCGPYIGLDAGAVRGDESVSWTALSGPRGFNAAGASDIINSSPGNVGTVGFTGGGQAGYNWQFQSVVAGVEADLQYTGVNGTRSFLSNSFLDPYAQSVRSDWLSTVRGRLGVATQAGLFYVTGGLAVAQVQFSDSFLGLHGIGPINSSVSDVRAGWTAGGGAEWAVAPCWTIKLEYLHVDLGSETDIGASTINSATITHMHSLTEEIARLGVNYHF
jgi:outer membrane immunogenic protein